MSNSDPLEAIADSPLRQVIVKGFSELYRVKPAFPVEHLAHWLKNYSANQARSKLLQESREQKHDRVAQMERKLVEMTDRANEEKAKAEQKMREGEEAFKKKVAETNYLSDLLVEYLPETIQNLCQDRGLSLTGCYVGQLKHRHKKLEEHNFEPGSEFDTENPKVIQYLGSTSSHRFMLGEILPNESGRSYEVFKEEEPPEEPEEGKPAKVKKNYLYVREVQRDEKMHFFKFPKLGGFACYPLKVKSCLFGESFDKGKEDFKTFTANKGQVEGEFKERLNEATNQFEEAKRKYEEHEINEEDPTSVSEHAGYQEEFEKAEQALKEVESSPPVIEPFVYETRVKEFVVCLDTMGRDSSMCEQLLDWVEEKVAYFKGQWEDKEYEMLLDDIKLYIEEEGGLEGQFNYFKDQEQAIIGANESQIKEQCNNREKESEYELSVLKVGKLLKVLQEEAFVKSMQSYLSYNIPKYSQIVQIVLMILNFKKEDINVPRSNSLDCRKCLKKDFIEQMMARLEEYELRRESSETVDPEYKINKLLERLEKIDSEAVGKYNSWLFGLLFTAKSVCWTRIQGRDAKIEAHELSQKAMKEREEEIVRYEQELEKAKEAEKALVSEETPPFNEEEFLKEYYTNNPIPEKLEVPELQNFLDIE